VIGEHYESREEEEPASRELRATSNPSTDAPVASGIRLATGTHLASGRLTIHRVLGEGGMGVVYEARDAERRCNVALKTLLRVDPAGLYSFKNEFRLLAGMSHPNLVQLHELFAVGDFWFFTMELVQGETFYQWVRPAGRIDEARLRRALPQLFAAVAEIHTFGRLHRDIKPSNVLVSKEGRVVVLDFGLAIEPELGGVGQTVLSLSITGTPAYMAPEQSTGAPATSATDYYAVGVMLFEALTGHLPFSGHVVEILTAKQRDDAPRPSSLAPDLPADLESLCSALLARDPRRRPTLAAIQAQLGAAPSTPPPSDLALATVRLVGREQELSELLSAYRTTLNGEAVVVVVSGESGIGKTALCDHFLRELRDSGPAVVLAGRCREQETVPFKALDTLIDELSRYLRRLPDQRAAALLPRDSFALRRLFPVLGRVAAIAEAPQPAHFTLQELRRRGFAALGELLARVRDRQPIVVAIDDLQWTDADSVALLRHLLIDRNPVPILLLIAHRSEDADGPLLSSVLEAASSNPGIRVRHLPLGPLSQTDTEVLAAQLLASQGPIDHALCEAIARESRGSPFFAAELARSAHEDGAPSISTALLSRVDLLPPGARQVLEILALVGRPLAVDVLGDAVAGESNDFDALRIAQLIRSRDDGGRRAVECYHDRIRESVRASLSAAKRARHYAVLANVLTARDEASAELCSTCLEHIGEHAGAARYAVTAAEQASAKMAFGQAATFYQRALDLTHGQLGERRDLLVKLAAALDNAGRGKAAADSFRLAAELSTGDEAIELRRRAAELLLVTGHLDEGLAQLKTVCRAVDVPMPSGKRRALASYVWNRAQLQWRGLHVPAHRERAITERDRLRLRIARTMLTGLIGYLPIQTASNAGRYLLLALEDGESTDLVRGIGFHAYIQTMIEPAGRYANELLDRMNELATSTGTPEATGFASLILGTSAYHCGRYTVAREHLARAVRTLRGCSGSDWEIDCANVYDQLVASDSGNYGHIALTTPLLIDEALRRGRVWTAAMLSGFGVHAWLVPDDPAGYATVLADAKRRWRGTPQPRWPDFVMLAGESQQLIYQSRAVAAFELFESEYDRYAKSEVMRSAGSGIGGYAVHQGRAAAAALRSGNASAAQRARMRRVLRSSVAALQRQGGPKRTGIASTFEAALAVDARDFQRARSLLGSAADVLESGGALMLAAAARRRAGQLAHGIERATLIELGDAFLLAQGVKNLEALTEVNCPGCSR